MGFFGLFSKKEKESLDSGLDKTRESFFSKITKAVIGKSTVDDEVLDKLEEVLVLDMKIGETSRAVGSGFTVTGFTHDGACGVYSFRAYVSGTIGG